MKKKTLKGFLIVTIVMVSLMAFIPAASSAKDKPINLLFGNFEPPMGQVARIMIEWGKELEKATQGRVKVSLSLGGAIGKPGEFYDLASKGVCDASACVPALGGPGLFPMSEMFELPFNIPTGVIASKAMQAWAKKGYLDKEFSDVKLMSVFGGSTDIIITKDKPVTTLADLKGMKIWNPMPMKSEMLKQLGAVPVAFSPGELYGGLQKGIIDGAFTNYMFIYIYKIDELTNYSTVGLPNGTVNVTTVMNKNKWNKLPQDIRQIIDGMSDKYSVKYGASFDTATNDGKSAFFKKGNKELEWKPEVLARADEKFLPIWEKFIEEKESKGLPARKAIRDFYNLLKDLGVETPAVGYKPN